MSAIRTRLQLYFPAYENIPPVKRWDVPFLSSMYIGLLIYYHLISCIIYKKTINNPE